MTQKSTDPVCRVCLNPVWFDYSRGVWCHWGHAYCDKQPPLAVLWPQAASVVGVIYPPSPYPEGIR